MALWKKLFLGCLFSGIVILALAAILVHLYVTPERVKSLVQTGLESSLRRKVDLGAVRVGLFSGIEIEELTIHNRQQDARLLTAENVDLSYDFSALLRGELLFNKILIKDPQLRLVREADGRLNIADLLGENTPEEKITTATTEIDTPNPANDIPLRVQQFSLQGGTLLFIDRYLNEQSPYRYRLDSLNINVSNFALDDAFPVNLSANLNGSPLSVDLQFGLVDGLENLKLHTNQLSLVPFLPYFQDDFPGSLGQGLLSMELIMRKQAKGFSLKGQVVLKQLDLRFDLDNPLHWDNVRIALDQDLFYRISDRMIVVKKFIADIDGVQFGYLGKLQLSDPVLVEGEADLEIIDIRKISTLLPQGVRQQIAAYAVAGNGEAHLRLSGPFSGIKMVQKASLSVAELQASIAGLRPALTGTLNYAAGRFQGAGLEVDLKGQQLAIDVEATNVLGPLPHLQLKIAGEMLDMDQLIPSPAPETIQESKVIETGAPEPEPSIEPVGPFKLPLTGRLNVQFAKLLYRGLAFENVQGMCSLQDGRLGIESLTTDTAAGAVALSVDAELEKINIPFRGNFRVTNINLATLADVLLPAGKGGIVGTLGAYSQFSGLTVLTDPLKKITAEGTFDLRDGEVKGNSLLLGLSHFLTTSEFDLVSFSRLHGQYGLKQGQGTIDAKLESSRMSIASKGKFALAGSIDMRMETKIAPEVMAKVGIGGNGLNLLKDENGWSILPLRVRGDYRKPHFALDSKGVKKQLKKTVVNELGRRLQKKLGGLEDDSKKQQLQELLNGTLNKLFGN